jgi:hypothetical protein
MKALFAILFITLISISGYSQSTDKTCFLRFTSIHGDISLKYSFLNQKTKRINYEENQTISFLSGDISLKTSNYFWHPNFVQLDLDLAYSPETGQRNALIAPNQNENIVLKKVYAKATFFQRNQFNFSLFTNFLEGYNNRENLVTIKSKFNNWGGTLNYTNNFLPLSFSYSQGKGTQDETPIVRHFNTANRSFEGRTYKTFGRSDHHELSYSSNEYFYQNIYASGNENIVRNRINIWRLNNNIFFDQKKNYKFNSRIIHEDQNGILSFRRFQAFESLFFRLPRQFTFRTNYNYLNYQGNIQTSRQHNVGGALTHQLYRSLRTSLSMEYNNLLGNQSGEEYKETNLRSGIEFQYSKRLPLKGLLKLTYSLNAITQDRKSEALTLFIQNEEQKLIDGQIILLNSQNVISSSVVVRDITGTILYQLNLDYILIQRNEYLEIQRVPGGQIANNSTVYIDYLALQPQSYRFTSITNFFRAGISLFQNGLEFYFETSKQNYSVPVKVDFLTLNFYNKNLFGAKFQYEFINGGIEYDKYESNIIPYRLTRYFLTLQGNIKQNLFYSIVGDFRDYHMIIFEGNKQKYYNLSGVVSYQLNPNTKFSLTGGYIKQEGDQLGINLDQLTGKFEVTTVYRQIYFTTSLELYSNIIYNESINLSRFWIQVSRRF